MAPTTPQALTPSEPPPRQPPFNTTRSGQCTHLTMTRFYSDDWQCSLCLEPGDLGWLYRCTQDCELLLEDEYERGYQELYPDLPPLLTSVPLPKPRSPAARRTGSLSFFRETNQKDHQIYTKDQIDIILKQRHKVLLLARESSLHAPADGLLGRGPLALLSYDEKPWLKVQECQFKCCHSCRPSSMERSFLSIDAIVNDDVPFTAITGFGFHLYGHRPVSLVKLIRNIGLRPNPPLRPPPWNSASKEKGSFGSPPTRLPSPPRVHHTASPTYASPFDDVTNADGTFGQNSNAYDSTPMTRRINTEIGPFVGLGIMSKRESPLKNARSFPEPHRKPPAEPCPFPYIENSEMLPSSLNNGVPNLSLGVATSASPITPENPSTPGDEEEEQSERESELRGFPPLTRMEREEEAQGRFGSGPLDVCRGVAMTEEAVELQVPDVVTQSRLRNPTWEGL